MAGLCAPLSTLRQYPHGYLRMTRVDAVRYSFIVMDLHHLLLAGLPAHSGLPRSTDIVRPDQLVRFVPCADINKRAQQFSKQSAKMTPNSSETKGRGTIPPECSNLCRRASAALGGRCTRGPAVSNLGEGLDLHQNVRASQSRHGPRRTLRGRWTAITVPQSS